MHGSFLCYTDEGTIHYHDDPSSVAQMVWCVQASSPACPVDCTVRVLRAGSRREHGEAPHAWDRPQGITHSTDTGEHTHHCIASLSQSVSHVASSCGMRLQYKHALLHS